MASCSISAFRNRRLTVRNPATGGHHTLLFGCDDDGLITLADADADPPAFVDRRYFTGFPTDTALMAVVSELLGAPCKLEHVGERGVELDESALAGLRKMPVDIFDDRYLEETKERALVLCVDIRNFSNFMCSNDEDNVFRLIKEFTSNLLSCVNQYGYGCSYYKLMGDGAIVIWDETDADSVGGALQVFDTYTDFVDEELFRPFPDLALAGALVMDKVFKYEISAEASQLKYRDYVGYGINLACRLQALAGRDELVVNRNLASTGLVPHRAHGSAALHDELRGLKGLKDEDRELVLLYDRHV